MERFVKCDCENPEKVYLVRTKYADKMLFVPMCNLCLDMDKYAKTGEKKLLVPSIGFY